jgi:glutamate racemase
MLIENNIFNKNKLKAIIKEKVNIHKLNKYKQIVLACTHYELVLNLFNQYAPNTKFICNSTKIVDNINIEEANGLNITLLTSKKSKKIEDVFYKLLN